MKRWQRRWAIKRHTKRLSKDLSIVDVGRAALVISGGNVIKNTQFRFKTRASWGLLAFIRHNMTNYEWCLHLINTDAELRKDPKRLSEARRVLKEEKNKEVIEAYFKTSPLKSRDPLLLRA